MIHLRTFIYVILLLLAIDIVTGTDNFFIQWVLGIWGAILAMHFVETLFFGGGVFGALSGHCYSSEDAPQIATGFKDRNA